MAFRRDFKHIILLLDVDDTLVNFKQSQPDNIIWTGGSSITWRFYLEALRAQGKNKDYQFHFGINTFKSTPDFLSLGVIDELNDLFKPIDDSKAQPNLIFHIGKNSKVKRGLIPAKEKIQTDFKTQIDDKDVWLFDDMKIVCDEANSKHRAAHVPHLNSGSINTQKETIASAFKIIFNEYKLDFTPPTLEAYDNEVIQYTPRTLNTFFDLSPDKLASLISTTTAAAASSGIKGLDDDEDAQTTKKMNYSTS